MTLVCACSCIFCQIVKGVHAFSFIYPEARRPCPRRYSPSLFARDHPVLQGVRNRTYVRHSSLLSLRSGRLTCAVRCRLAFLDIGPVSEGHTQVIPKRKSHLKPQHTGSRRPDLYLLLIQAMQRPSSTWTMSRSPTSVPLSRRSRR